MNPDVDNFMKCVYVFETILQEHTPDLLAHFEDLGIEVHMFASQWFLTLFTAKFPLNVVFYIIDLFLLQVLFFSLCFLCKVMLCMKSCLKTIYK